MTKRGGGKYLFAAALLLAAALAAPVFARDLPDQRAQRHLADGQPDPALYSFSAAGFTPGLPAIPLRGPAEAKGLIIWSHGRDINREAPSIAPAAIWALARDGWDVYALHRLGTHDVLNVSLRIVDAGVEAGKALGYKRIVLAGQSVGGFMSIAVAALRGDVGGVLALAPAAWGTPDTAENWRQNDTRLRELWEKLRGRRMALGVAFFAGDPFFEKSEPAIRGPWAKQRLAELGLPALVLDRPVPQLFSGHGAGLSVPFGRRFAPCLILLLERQQPPPCEDGERGAIATFALAPLPAQPAIPGDAFAGLWQGTTSEGRYLVLQLGPPLEGQQRSARYALGRNLTPEVPAPQLFNLTIEGNRLRKDNHVSIQPEADGRLRWRLQQPGGAASETLLQRLN